MKRRTGVGHLERKRVSAAYRKRLGEAWSQLLLWGAVHSVRFQQLAESPDEMDEALHPFVEATFHEKWNFTLVKYAILAVQFRYPWLKQKLKRTWTAAKAWALTRPWRPRVPIARDLLQALALTGLDLAAQATSTSQLLPWVIFSVLVRVGFEALLRPTELLSLTAHDCRVVHRAAKGAVIVIGIRDPKTRQRGGRAQFGMVKDPEVVAWFSWLLDGHALGVPIWPLSKQAFRHHFNLGLQILQAHHLGLTPASLRSGGATDKFLEGETVERLMHIGRWLSFTSLRCYIQESMAHFSWSQLSSSAQASITALVKRYHKLLASPPQSPFVDVPRCRRP